MKKSVKEWVIAIFVVLLILIIVGLIWHFKSSKKPSDNKPKEEAPVVIDVAKIISEIKEENKDNDLVYESANIPEFTILVYAQDYFYNSILIDSKDGTKTDFLDLVNKDLFKETELRLLNLKYPEFIVNALNNTEVKKHYYVKDNEVIIYYDNYTLAYPYNETLSLNINYNEIKDLIKFTPVLDTEYQNADGFNYDASKKAVAITFDDGPSPKYNELILNTLKANKAHATFFMVGYMMKSCQSCVIATASSGNEVGSHTYDHINIKTNSEATVKNNVTKNDDLYYSLTNKHFGLLRPPYGSYSKSILNSLNIPFVLWNLDTEDWRYRDVDHIVNYIKNNVSDGSIILMHELYETSYEALKEILPWLYVNGYQVVSVSELAKLKGKTIANGNAYYNFK